MRTLLFSLMLLSVTACGVPGKLYLPGNTGPEPELPPSQELPQQPGPDSGDDPDTYRMRL